jgi:asparagine synthase (glutamine-hydrolysing)
MWIAYFSDLERADLYTPEFRASLGDNRTADVIAVPYAESDAPTGVERLLDVDINAYLPGALLVKVDIATMAHSLEVRSPFLDHKFLEAVARMPGDAKLSGTTTKKVLKDALRPWLPDHILDRDKMGFGVPLPEWFRGELRDLPGEILLDPRSLDRGLFRPDAVRALIDNHHNRVEDNASKIWALLQLELWFRMYVDAPVPTSAPLVLAS